MLTNVGRALVKEKVLILRSKETDTINNADIYDTYKGFSLSNKEHGEMLLQGIQSANSSKDCAGTKKADGMATRMMTQENAIKTTFGERVAIHLDFDFFKYPVYRYGLNLMVILLKGWFWVAEIPQRHTSFQTFLQNMVQYFTNVMQQQ